MPLDASAYVPRIDFWTRQQREAFELSLHRRTFYLAMDPRTGKSKPCVDTACYHYENPRSELHITGVLIVAWPNGVHRGWITDAFPENVPDRIPWRGFVWRAAKAGQVTYEAEFDALLTTKALAVFAVNAESLTSDACKLHIGRFLGARKRVMAIADEISFMATPNARRNKTMQNLAKKTQVVIKRALDGTPVGNGGPLDLYAQYKFLDWSILGFRTNAEFKEHYAEWEIKLNHNTNQSYPALVGYRNIEELHKRIAPYTYRATFAECFTTPRKVYQKRYFQLTPLQRKVYDELREKHRVSFAHESYTVAHQLTRMLRAQQIGSNRWPGKATLEVHEPCSGMGCDGCDGTGVVETRTEPTIIDPDRNPRLDALAEELKPGDPTIVWCRFRDDAQDAFDLAKAMGLGPVRYDGTVDDDAKVLAKDDFQAGRAGVFVGNQRSAGRGIPLWRARGHVYYSNAFSVRDRVQSEDRAEIAHRTQGTSVVDLVAEDTVDDLSIIPALRAGMDVAALILRDPKKDWL